MLRFNWIIWWYNIWYNILLDYQDEEETCLDPSWKGPDIQQDIEKGNSISILCPGGCIQMKMVGKLFL